MAFVLRSHSLSGIQRYVTSQVRPKTKCNRYITCNRYNTHQCQPISNYNFSSEQGRPIYSKDMCNKLSLHYKKNLIKSRLLFTVEMGGMHLKKASVPQLPTMPPCSLLPCGSREHGR